jgi:ketosteroid isomerase-like protein
MGEKNTTDMTDTVERIYKAWDQALGAKDLDAALALYASDATIESPLVAHLLGVESGICQGHEELRRFIHLVFQRQPAERKHFRTGYFTDGTKLMWEYPRATPDGEQMDLVEVMELKEGLIQHHRVYWGWFGLSVLTKVNTVGRTD